MILCYFRCYDVNNYEPATFLDAMKECQSNGGTLVDIYNAFENTYVAGLAALVSVDNYWLGMNLLTSTNWSWISGENVTYTNWAPGQPGDGTAYLCGPARTADNQWTKELCSAKKPYVCQYDPDVSESMGACSWGYCSDPNYTLNPDACKCYKYVPTPTPYKYAAELCASEGATLAIVLTQFENYFLSGYVSKLAPAGGDFPMLGLSCAGKTPSSCRWIDDTPLIFSYFMGDNSVIRPNCSAVLYEDSLSWNCFPSDSPYPFVCQKTGIASY